MEKIKRESQDNKKRGGAGGKSVATYLSKVKKISTADSTMYIE